MSNVIKGYHLPNTVDSHTLVVAIRFKNSLQENAKTHAMADVIETSHNGIVSWEKKTDVNPILIQGKDDYQNKRKMEYI